MTAAAIDSVCFRQLLGSYPTGVSVITAVGVKHRLVGMVVITRFWTARKECWSVDLW
jgi:flavin reductase (DIM6/NTAB) family NADH-FMN oxidoreductase RutF